MRLLTTIFALAALALGGCGAPPSTSTDAGRADAAAGCTSDLSCDDGLFCNGSEVCRPGSPSANADGCVAGVPPCEDGTCDEASDVCATCTTDLDADGHVSIECGGDDCDDDDPNRFPGNVEVCDGSHDEDCNPDTYGSRDVDGDGVDDALCCNGSACATDCDDSRSDRYPGLVEACDGIDNDCDSATDEGLGRTYYLDDDGDGFGTVTASIEGGCTPPPGYRTDSTDCDDTRADRNPGAPETCDAIDNDCDLSVDEGAAAVDWYFDSDGDGWGDPSLPSVSSCAPVSGRVPRGRDCDDTRADRNPAAPEACDTLDNDCDTSVDEGVLETFYRDADGDGFGSPSTTMQACSTPSGYVTTSTDCDDANSSRNPGLAEVCDAITDNDCNPTTNPFDADLDGQDRFSCGGLDCDDALGTIYAGAPELCDRRDTTCAAGGGVRPAEDMDDDGYASPTAPCTGGALPRTDCDDARAGTHPGAAEECNGIDDDCDLAVDDEPAATLACSSFPGTESVCTAGACAISRCLAPFEDCNASASDGCEANLDASLDDCGTCGRTCVGGSCSGGMCVCPVGFADCAGTCIDVRSDPANCGGCGVVCGLGATCTASACSPSVVFARTFGERASYEGLGNGTSDSVGNLYVVTNLTAANDLFGYAATPTGVDAYLVAMTDMGALRWVQAIGGPGDEALFGVTTDSAGNVYVAGWTTSPTVDLGGGPLAALGSNDVLIASYATDGSFRWGRRYAATGDNLLTRLATDPAGSRLLVAGQTSDGIDFGSGTTPGRAFTTASLDAATGDAVWVNSMPTTFGASTSAWGVALDASARAYVALEFSETIDFGVGPITAADQWDGLVMSLSSTGALRWSRIFGGLGPDRPFGLVLDGPDVVFTTHTADASPDFGGGPLGTLGVPKSCLIRLTQDGALVRGTVVVEGQTWGLAPLAARPGGGVVISGYVPHGIDLGLGPLGVVGTSGSMPYFLALDSMHAPEWNIAFSPSAGSAVFESVTVLPGGDAVAFGAFNGSFTFGGTAVSTPAGDGLVVRVSPK